LFQHYIDYNRVGYTSAVHNNFKKTDTENCILNQKHNAAVIWKITVGFY